MGKILDHLEEWLIAFLMAAATLVIFAAVVHRHLCGAPIPVVQDWLISLNFSWAQELCIIMFIWMVKFGAAYGVRTGIHVGVDVLINRLPPAWRRWSVLLGLTGGALFTATVGVLAIRFVWGNGLHYALFHALGRDTGDLSEGPTTPDLEWPTWVVYLCVPLGSFLMCLRFLQVAVRFFRTGELPHTDDTKVEGLDPAPAQETRP